MADLVITAANVAVGVDALTETGTAGETITAGQAICLDPTTQKFLRADSNHANADIRVVRGVALNGASLNQPVTIQRAGKIAIGATLTTGATYYLSDAPGGICPFADVGSGEYVALVGIAVSTSQMLLDLHVVRRGSTVIESYRSGRWSRPGVLEGFYRHKDAP